jgi:hypothetical protein
VPISWQGPEDTVKDVKEESYDGDGDDDCMLLGEEQVNQQALSRSSYCGSTR